MIFFVQIIIDFDLNNIQTSCTMTQCDNEPISKIIENPHFRKYMEDTGSDGSEFIVILKDNCGKWGHILRVLWDEDDNSIGEYSQYRLCDKCGDHTYSGALINCEDCGGLYCSLCMKTEHD